MIPGLLVLKHKLICCKIRNILWDVWGIAKSQKFQVQI